MWWYGEGGEIKLEWFVGKANWDGVRTEKCGIVNGNRRCERKRDELARAGRK